MLQRREKVKIALLFIWIVYCVIPLDLTKKLLD